MSLIIREALEISHKLTYHIGMSMSQNIILFPCIILFVENNYLWQRRIKFNHYPDRRCQNEFECLCELLYVHTLVPTDSLLSHLYIAPDGRFDLNITCLKSGLDTVNIDHLNIFISIVYLHPLALYVSWSYSFILSLPAAKPNIPY